MSIVNRRNAMIGWATWRLLKQLAKRNAAKAASTAQREEQRARRWRRGDDEAAQAKKRRTRRLLGAAAAAGVGTGIWLGARSRQREEAETSE